MTIMPFNRFLIIIIHLLLAELSYSQAIDSTIFTTNKKPLLDKSAKSKGLLGGRVSTSGVPTVNEIKEKIGNGKEAADNFKSETLPDLGLKVKKVKAKAKEFLNRNEYEGIKMEKRIATFGNGNRLTTEEFFVLNDEAEISMYARDLRWYDYQMQRTSTNAIKNIEEADILHGPYKRFVADELVEEGFFYLGTKHGRWERYGKEFDNDYVLLEKQNYFKGHPAESEISYYDAEKTKINEIIPFQFGKKTGDYFAYFPSGNIKEEGHYDDGVKIGKWIEYHEFGTGSKRKKETQFQKDKYDTGFESYIIREYDAKAKLIFENTEALKNHSHEN
jgi:antitoxin component YwqK of YwqJK toxin-antitoxin module